MSDLIHDSKIPADKKHTLILLIQTMLNDVNKQITHLGINNYMKLQDEIAKILVPVIEDKME
ncbi:hypothetical protein EHQ23_17390 [Leptospira bourretii]|uniref:Uncharacterized protein n=7 Tax=Leptospira TaxID=171 RepID=A0AAW5VFT8_9LEPT|nr:MULTISPECIES: hypothetical protein [Leptospira]PKA27016.1 hypothetical protein CH381_07200 [Leptospira sp. mixed culture ATI2-C-A1]EKJ88617.1 hypothetical protein LEP1GSC017_3876 [Leptospira meyeri serovar Hardjo str. Went 5]EMJ86621.1 hypothetical protein LEP1GSC196_3074 [Leptospira meyeri serovar Semaranga str. Veldrot Semarang 173]MCG6142153.1 hypothetical protein [Leptospira mtsangambouensis]MCG6153018.1 hypothetical protein [Leptospira bandrabouensis]